MKTRRLLLIALAAGLCFAAAAPSVASAQPCWQRVISDWTKDGVINGHYSPRCLRQAYKNTPEDLRDYSSILDDISAALVAKSSIHSGGGGPSSGTSPVNGPNSAAATAAAKKKAEEEARAAAEHAVPGAGTPASAPAHDRPIPLPLIVLAAVIIAGAVAGAAPHGLKWYRARSPRVRPRPNSVRPPA